MAELLPLLFVFAVLFIIGVWFAFRQGMLAERENQEKERVYAETETYSGDRYTYRDADYDPGHWN